MIQLTSTDPSDIANAARCFASCVPVGQQQALRTYLLVQLGNINTPPCVTPTAPSSVQVSSAHLADPNTQLSVRWSQPANSGSLIMAYTVFWGTSAGGPYTNNSGRLAASGRSYLITGLTAGTTYYVVVQSDSSMLGCNSANSAEANGTTSGSSICAAGVAFASAWAARVVINGGGAPSVPTQNAIANFQCGLIADGLDTKMLVWNAFVPDNLIAAITPQLGNYPSFGGNDPWANNNFVLGDLSVNGITGNAANKYLATGFITPAAFQTSFGVAVYNYLANATGGEYGAYNGASGVLGDAKFTDNNAYSFSGSVASNAITVASPGNGFYSAQRVSVTDHRMYFATSLSPHAQIGATDVNNSGALPGALGFYIMAQNLNGAPSSTCSNTISFFAFTAGLSAADSAKLYARVQILRQALGGGFR